MRYSVSGQPTIDPCGTLHDPGARPDKTLDNSPCNALHPASTIRNQSERELQCTVGIHGTQ